MWMLVSERFKSKITIGKLRSRRVPPLNIWNMPILHGYLCSPPRSACSFLLRLPQQTCRTLRKPCSRQSPPAQLAVCCWSDSSVGGSCPTPARTRRSGYRSLVCSRPSFGRSWRNRRVFSERQSSPLLRWIGRRKRQSPAGHPDRSWRHRWRCGRTCSVLRSSPLWTKITKLIKTSPTWNPVLTQSETLWTKVLLLEGSCFWYLLVCNSDSVARLWHVLAMRV